MSRTERVKRVAAFVLFVVLSFLVVSLLRSVGCTDESAKIVLPAADAAALSLSGRGPDAGVLRSPGCGGRPPVDPGVLVKTSAGRTFRVYPPKSYDPSVAYPVLFTYHGIDSNSGQFQAWFKMEEHVNGEAIVVYPDARKTAYGAAWELAGERDLVAFDDIRGAVAQSFCIDVSRIYAMGFSYGGKFVTALACRRPGALRAISSNDSSWGNANEQRCSAMPVLVTHRTNDPDELLEWGRASANTWARIDGCKGPEAQTPTDQAHGCADYVGCKEKVTFCEDRFVNETWPKEWNHTVREEYRDLVWRWLRER